MAEGERSAGPVQPGDERFRLAMGRGMLAGAGLLGALVLYGPIRFPAIWTGPSREPARRLRPDLELPWLTGPSVGSASARGGAAIRRSSELAPCLDFVAACSSPCRCSASTLVPHDESAGPWIALATFGLFFLLLFTAGFVARIKGLSMGGRAHGRRLGRCDRLGVLVHPSAEHLLRVSGHAARGPLFWKSTRPSPTSVVAARPTCALSSSATTWAAGSSTPSWPPLLALPLGFLGGLVGSLVKSPLRRNTEPCARLGFRAQRR